MKFHCLLYFLRNIHTGVLSVEDGDKEQNKLFKKLCDINNGEKSFEKSIFWKKYDFSMIHEKKVLRTVKVIYFQ